MEPDEFTTDLHLLVTHPATGDFVVPAATPAVVVGAVVEEILDLEGKAAAFESNTDADGAGLTQDQRLHDQSLVETYLPWLRQLFEDTSDWHSSRWETAKKPNQPRPTDDTQPEVCFTEQRLATCWSVSKMT